MQTGNSPHMTWLRMFEITIILQKSYLPNLTEENCGKLWKASGPDGQMSEPKLDCSWGSRVSITNRVLTPTQTVFIPLLPQIQTFTYLSLLPHAWKYQVGLCPAETLLKDVPNDCWHGICLILCFIAFIQRPCWLQLNLTQNSGQANTEFSDFSYGLLL